MTARAAAHRVRLDLAWAGLLTLLVLAPLLAGTGYWLVGDMVFVPRQPWKPAWLGLDGALPRAVPMDALVSVATSVVPGWVLQRLLLVGGFLVGGWATSLLLREHGTAARWAGIALVLWNPWVLERLLMGQWAITLGALLLPAVVVASVRFREEPRAGWAPLAAVLIGSAVCSPSSGLVAVGVALGVGVGRRVRSGLAVLGLGLLANATWLLPAVTGPRSGISTDGVFSLFAARAESAAGLLPSLLSLGGTWKSSVVPSARTDAALVLLACVLTAVAVAGLRRARPVGGAVTTVRLAAVSVLALGVALLPSLPGGDALLEGLAADVPGLALLRDGHRFLPPLTVLLAVGVAGAVDTTRVLARPGREALGWAGSVLVVAPLLLLPQQAWGAAGTLAAVDYPADWQEVVDAVERRDPARTVVLPWAGSYRGFAWNDRRAVLDPAPRLLPGEVVVDDRTFVDGRVVASEDPLVGDVADALAGTDPHARLVDLGVDLVLVETPDRLSGPDAELLAELEAAGAVEVARATELRLMDLGGTDEEAQAPPGPGTGEVVAVVAGHAASALLALAAAGWVLVRRRQHPVLER